MKLYFCILVILFLNLLKLDSQIAISGYNHVGLSVDDINKSTHFYKNIIGLKPIAVPSYLKKIRSWFQIAPGQELHLLAGRKDPVTNNHSNGAHFSFSITDASKIATYLDVSKMKYIKQQRFDGAWQIYVTDPDGYVIELNEPKVNWTNLFNGVDIKNWKMIPQKYSSLPNFTIEEIEGESVMKVHSSNDALLVSKKEYANYHLQLEYKWIAATTPDKSSGLFYHISNNKSYEEANIAHELEIKQNETGSYNCNSGVGATISIDNKKAVHKAYRKMGIPTLFTKNENGENCHLSQNQEYAIGEWNILDLYCFGDMTAHMINGKTVMVLKNGWQNPNGKTHKTLTGGKIALQANGAEIHFKNIKISNLDSMPENIINQDNY